MDQPDLARLIVTNLADLDSAAQYVTNDLQRAVADALDHLAETFLRHKEWNGVTKWFDEAIWLAPKDWLKRGDHTGDDYQCQFNLDESLGKGEAREMFWLTKLVGIGDRSYGLRWARNDVKKRQWRNLVGQQEDSIVSLRGRGFIYEELEGSFFLPVRIDQNELAQAVGDESPELALAPFTDALETCFNAKADFDVLLAAIAGID